VEPGGSLEDVFRQVARIKDRLSAALTIAKVNEENSTRTAEYKALAEKEHVDVSAIVKRMAKRNLENARIGDMVKDESGTWRRK
jgi:uncharacterized protein YdbL (DUF1318 family)